MDCGTFDLHPSQHRALEHFLAELNRGGIPKGLEF
jgi:hypothetical protein